MRRQNLDALKRVEREQIGISSNHVSCDTLNGQFEEFVITRIATHRNSFLHIDPYSFAGQGREKSSDIFLINVPAEAFSGQDFIQLGKCSERKQDDFAPERPIESLTGFGLGQEQRADEDVCIEDAAQLRAL